MYRDPVFGDLVCSLGLHQAAATWVTETPNHFPHSPLLPASVASGQKAKASGPF